MKKILLIFLFLIGSCLSFSIPQKENDSQTGHVTYEGKSDYFIIETYLGCTLVEVYSGHLEVDDYVYGELEDFGFADIYNKTKKEMIRVWIENYWWSRKQCFDWLREHGKIR